MDYVIACGSREWSGDVSDVLSRYVDKSAILITGGARGADRLADQWAEISGIQRIIIPANWKGVGRYAGLQRNELMISIFPVVLVIAFWDGQSRGTQDMIARAERHHVPVKVVEMGK